MKEHYKKHEMQKQGHSLPADMNDQLVISLRDISHTMRFLYEGKGSQKRILIVLNEIGEAITQQQLTKRLGIRPGSASEVIGKLENAGFITRTQNETDRRIVNIELTAAGKHAAQEAKQQRNKRHEDMFSCLSIDEKNELILLLDKINNDWQKRYSESQTHHIDRPYKDAKHHK